MYKSSVSIEAKQCRCRILFAHKNGSQLKSEADLLLALNEKLQTPRVESKNRFNRVQYSLSWFILALLIEKANATSLLFPQSYLLI